MERILKKTIRDIRLDTKSLARLADTLDRDGDGARVTTSDTSTEIEGLVEMGDETCTMDPVDDQTTHYSGEFSYWNFSMRLKQQIEQMGGLESQSHDSDRAWDFPRAHQLRPVGSHLSAAMSCSPPRPVGEFLARVFFKYVETHYYFIEKTWFIDKMNLLYEDPSRFATKGGEVIISILLTVFAIGSQYAHLESTASGLRDQQEQSFSEEDIGATFYQQAIRLLPEIIELSSLESVQACLLFGYYALPVDTSGLGYVYVNLAIRLGMQNGMHRKCATGAFNATMVEARNRVWWTAYLLERKISIFHGRPLSVLQKDVDASLPVFCEGMESEDSRTSVARAEASVQLIRYLEQLFTDVNALRGCQRNQIPKIIAHLLASKEALKTWWDSLPKNLTSSALQPLPQLRSAMHFQLEHCLVRMFIGRPFLLRQESSDSTSTSPAESVITSGDKRHSSNRTRLSHKDLIDDCIESATEALSILQGLRDNTGLARASYVEYSSCRASLLVLIAYSIQQFSERYRNLLYKGLDMIREMSAAGESARSEVSLIETLERALARLHARIQRAEQGGSSQLEPSPSDYEAFKHWGAMMRDGVISTDTDSDRAPVSLGSAGSAGPLPEHSRVINQSFDQPWAFNPSQNTLSVSDQDMGMLCALDPLTDIPFFGAESSSPSAAWPMWTEAQVLEQFLSGSRLDSISEADASHN
ncbi:hypothetical protein POX_b02946 [Penicillium oxalicum]|uniref:hypothetical protein n=1 Tax=Penicillium oxalicum TaxID=69781 RepID=UPI0020B78B04|nr:hypothetical protein POX_b02946 [Penicillium oxalicum]KAI2792902.1 hypothetical protein POX_b02946 [Penicillium oxalicum]